MDRMNRRVQGVRVQGSGNAVRSSARPRARRRTSPKATVDTRQASMARAAGPRPPDHSLPEACVADCGMIRVTVAESDFGAPRCQLSAACSSRTGRPWSRSECHTKPGGRVPRAPGAQRPRNSRRGCELAASWETSVVWPRAKSSRNAPRGEGVLIAYMKMLRS